MNRCLGRLLLVSLLCLGVSCSRSQKSEEVEQKKQEISICGPSPGPGEQCFSWVCDSQSQSWEIVPKNEGLSCNDGNACTYGDICRSGDCAGTAISCGDTGCAVGTCNGTSSCTYTLKSAATVCRPSVNATCDPAEVCDGVTLYCPADVHAAGGTSCTLGPCYNLGSCDSYTGACFSAPKPAGTVVASHPGTCQKDDVCGGGGHLIVGGPWQAGIICQLAYDCWTDRVCDGTNLGCPAARIASAGTLCRPPPSFGGECDVPEYCDGVNSWCPADLRKPTGTVCRPSTGPCDPAEVCYGFGGPQGCPPDQLAAAGTVCRAAVGACDLPESCNGSSAACPANSAKPAGTVCRAAAGPCDVTETCDGSPSGCPLDRKKLAGTVCRPATVACDAPETCDGAGNACPSDAFASASAECGTNSCDHCSGINTSCVTDTSQACFTKTYRHDDALGSVYAQTDASGNVVARYDYLPYGELYSGARSTVDLSFNSRVRDATGLIALGERNFSPALGRFLSPDTQLGSLEEPQTLNRYGYCRLNPYRYEDPSGRIPIDTIWDLANVIYDIAVDDREALAWDLAALAIPYVPAGSNEGSSRSGKAIAAVEARGQGRRRRGEARGARSRGGLECRKGGWC